MADDIVLPGTGGTVAGDLISNALYQRVKLSFGADGAAADWDGTQHVGEVGGKTTVTAITFTTGGTVPFSDGDVLADTQILAACLRVNDGTGILQDAVFNDKDDQNSAFDVIVMNANTSLGTENSAPNITAANADTIIGRFSVTGADWYDMGASRIANIRNIGIGVKGASGADDIYIGLINRGTAPVYGTATGITGYFKILCD